MPRYVILHHEMPTASQRATHWDLMLEWGDVLRTWELPREPAVPLACQAARLADHRKDYLEYEGPVSNDRGTVTRWDEGNYHVDHEQPGRLVVTLAGQRLGGGVRLSLEGPLPADSAHLWTVSFSAAPTRG